MAPVNDPAQVNDVEFACGSVPGIATTHKPESQFPAAGRHRRVCPVQPVRAGAGNEHVHARLSGPGVATRPGVHSRD